MAQKNIRDQWLDSLRLAILACEATAQSDDERRMIKEVGAMIKPKQPFHECYTIGVDIQYDEDLSVMTILKRSEPDIRAVACFIGQEAEVKYKQFVNEFCTGNVTRK